MVVGGAGRHRLAHLSVLRCREGGLSHVFGHRVLDVGEGVALAGVLAPRGSPRLHGEGVLEWVLGETVHAMVGFSLVPRGLDEVHTHLLGRLEEEAVVRKEVMRLNEVGVGLVLSLPARPACRRTCTSHAADCGTPRDRDTGRGNVLGLVGFATAAGLLSDLVVAGTGAYEVVGNTVAFCGVYIWLLIFGEELLGVVDVTFA